jgi:hypothetical protein
LPLAFALVAAACSSKKATPDTQSQASSTGANYSTVVFQAIGSIDEVGMERAAKIVRSRLQRLGHPVSRVQVKGRRLVIRMPGSIPPVRAGAAEKPGLLELYDLETSLTGPSVTQSEGPVETTDLYRLLSKIEAQATSAPPESYYLFTARHAHFSGQRRQSPPLWRLPTRTVYRKGGRFSTSRTTGPS